MTNLTNEAIESYRATAAACRAWRHVLLCDIAMSRPLDAKMLARLDAKHQASIATITPSEARTYLNSVINADPFRRT